MNKYVPYRDYEETPQEKDFIAGIRVLGVFRWLALVIGCAGIGILFITGV
jgi:hypothetical protein